MLSLLGFLLLLAPFYDHCNGHGMKIAEANTEASIDTTTVETDSVKIETTQINKVDIDTLRNSTSLEKTPFYEKHDKAKYTKEQY